MKFALLFGAFCALTANAVGSVLIQSVTSSWTGTVTVRRAVTLGGGLNTGGEAGTSTDSTLLRPFGGHAQVGPDYADVVGEVQVTTTAAGVYAQYEYDISGQIQHPMQADFGVAQMDVMLGVRIAFLLDAPTDICLSTTEAIGDLVGAGILDLEGNGIFGIGFVETRTQTLPAGSYEARFLYIGPSFFFTGVGNTLKYVGNANFQLTVPQPCVLALPGLVLLSYGRRRDSRD